MSSENIRVIVRCRPFNDREKHSGHKRVVEIDQKRGSVTIRNPATLNASNAKDIPPPASEDNPDCKTFSFDGAFGEDSKQVCDMD